MIFEEHANLKYKFGYGHFLGSRYYVDLLEKMWRKSKNIQWDQLQEDMLYDQMPLKKYIDPFTGELVNVKKIETDGEIKRGRTIFRWGFRHK